MVEFTKAQLYGLGNLGGKEFSIRKVVGDNGNETDQVITKERWFGGRLARHHKIKSGEDRTAKQIEYGRAKMGVLQSLKKIYGTEIGEKAFKAHIGKTVDGEYDLSFDHPITSRHIRQMLKTAEKELREQIVVQEFNRDFRGTDGKVMSERATAAWMMSKSVGLRGTNGQPLPFSNSDGVTNLIRGYEYSEDHQERHDGRIPIGDYHYKLRGSRVTDQVEYRRQDLPKGTPIARNLLGPPPPDDGDLSRFLRRDPGEKDGFWTLELDLAKPVGGRNNHVIGIHVNRDNPDIINVFDANRVEVSVPRDHFEDWLDKHLDGYGEIRRTTLYRSEETLLGSFEKRDGSWRWDEYLELEPFEIDRLRDDVMPKFEGCVDSGTNENGLYRLSMEDIDRFKFVIEGGGDPVKLNSHNIKQQLLELVRDDSSRRPKGDKEDTGGGVGEGPPQNDGSVSVGDDEIVPNFFDDDDKPGTDEETEDGYACRALSCFLNQDVVTSMDGVMKEKLPFDRLDNYFIPQGTEYKDDLGGEIRREDNNIYIRFYKDRDIFRFLGLGTDFHRLSPQTDCFNFDAEIVVTIDELRQAGKENRVPNFEFVEPPTGRLHIEGYRGLYDKRVPGSRPPPSFNEALELPSLVTDEEWAPQEEIMRNRTRDQDTVRFGTKDGDDSVPYSFDVFVRSHHMILSVEDEILTPISLQDQPNTSGMKQPHEVFIGVAGGEDEALQLAKLIDRDLIIQFTEEALIASGLAPDHANDIMVESYPVDVRRVEDHGQQFVEIKLSHAIDPNSLHGQALVRPPGDERECYVSMIIRVSLDDLQKGQPENFTVERKPFFEVIGEPPQIDEQPQPDVPQVDEGNQHMNQNVNA